MESEFKKLKILILFPVINFIQFIYLSNHYIALYIFHALQTFLKKIIHANMLEAELKSQLQV